MAQGAEEPSFLEAAAQQVSVALDVVDGAVADGWEAIFGTLATYINQGVGCLSCLSMEAEVCQACRQK